MRLVRSFRAALTAAATMAAATGLALTGTGTAQAATPLPNHVFAPYFEAWTGESPAALSAQSGAKHLTMAFLQTATKGSCTPYWNGDTSMPVAASTFGADIKTIQNNGGDVIPSFGGYTADTTGTEIADSCTDVQQIAAAYEKVITTYDISRLDMDIEVDSLDNTAAIDRRNKAIKLVQDWAAANGRKVEISYTLPTTTHGLGDTGEALLRNAVANGTRVDVVNLMTFDYYDNQAHDMAKDTQTAAQGLYDLLAQLYPGKSAAQLWNMVGVTEMPGVDDFGKAETSPWPTPGPCTTGRSPRASTPCPSGRCSATTAAARAVPPRTTARASSRTPGTSRTSSRRSPVAPAPRPTTSPWRSPRPPGR